MNRWGMIVGLLCVGLSLFAVESEDRFRGPQQVQARGDMSLVGFFGGPNGPPEPAGIADSAQGLVAIRLLDSTPHSIRSVNLNFRGYNGSMRAVSGVTKQSDGQFRVNAQGQSVTVIGFPGNINWGGGFSPKWGGRPVWVQPDQRSTRQFNNPGGAMMPESRRM